MIRRLAPFVFLLLLSSLLYGAYLSSPIFYDDIYFFIDPGSYVKQYLESWNPFARRWVSYSTFALTWQQWGAGVEPYRITNLMLHVAVACSIYLFVRDLLSRHGYGMPDRPAFIAAALFSLHPVAVFAAGAIIQRSIVMATLFSLWMWIAVGRGVSRQHLGWTLFSIVCYYLAVFSKEQAVAAAGVAVFVAWDAARGDWRRTFRTIVIPLIGWIAVAIAIVLVMRGFIGSSYEPLVAEMGMPDDEGREMLGRSIVNQAHLWFRYVLLWVIPYEQWMAVDLRLSFPASAFSAPWILGAIAYALYPLVIALFYRAGKLSTLAVIGLISPWLLFVVQFSAVQYQESFVLYRSYLWAAPATILVGMGVAKLANRAQWATLAIAVVFLFGLSWSRLQTLSMPVLIWDESVERMQGRDDLPGAYRVYYNRGIANLGLGAMDRALADMDKAIALNPSYPYAYNGRGSAYLGRKQYAEAIASFDKVIGMAPDYPGAYIQKARALIAIGRRNDGLKLLKSACDLGYGCKLYKETLTATPPAIHELK